MSATVQLHFQPKRLLTKSEAAHHCGRSVRRFEVECPIAPVAFSNGDRRYDVRDLDRWIDGLKAGAPSDVEDIVARLK